MSDRPFGFDTLTIPAVLVSDGDPASAQEAAWTVGFDAIRLPAVLVPVGGTPPAGDYVKLGVIARPIKAKVASPTMTPEEQSFPSAPTDEIGPQLLPRTRYRQNGLEPGNPPNINLQPGSPDPVQAGIAARRVLAGPRAGWPQSTMGSCKQKVALEVPRQPFLPPNPRLR